MEFLFLFPSNTLNYFETTQLTFILVEIEAMGMTVEIPGMRCYSGALRTRAARAAPCRPCLIWAQPGAALLAEGLVVGDTTPHLQNHFVFFIEKLLSLTLYKDSIWKSLTIQR